MSAKKERNLKILRDKRDSEQRNKEKNEKKNQYAFAWVLVIFFLVDLLFFIFSKETIVFGWRYGRHPITLDGNAALVFLTGFGLSTLSNLYYVLTLKHVKDISPPQRFITGVSSHLWLSGVPVILCSFWIQTIQMGVKGNWADRYCLYSVVWAIPFLISIPAISTKLYRRIKKEAHRYEVR